MNQLWWPRKCPVTFLGIDRASIDNGIQFLREPREMDYFVVVVVVVSELRDVRGLFLYSEYSKRIRATPPPTNSTGQVHEIIVYMQLRIDTTLVLMPRGENQVQVTQHGRLP
jgi:hypothetical protein